jgi:phosphopantothenoylcysteine decarboxylase/phosphopantothenate--cysteine ligase
MAILKGKTILLGVTGSVAAYKSVELVRRLKDEGASVRVIMTEASGRFVTPLSLELASGSPVFSDLFQSPLSHIQLPAEADVFVVAPATADLIARHAQGRADDLLAAALLAFRGPVIMAPAMNWRMWEHPAVQHNLSQLLSRGVATVGPERGSLACGEEGTGRMADPETIIDSVKTAVSRKDLQGEKFVVTAGPTREPLDPVRYLSNRSSGRMGYAVAINARRRGAEVVLISGPVSLPRPWGVTLRTVETAAEMHEAVLAEAGRASVLVMCAAVADFRPRKKAGKKIDKVATMSLDLAATADILADVGSRTERPFCVGFSAETGEGRERARRKLREKNLDMIVFNDVTKAGSGFDVTTNEVVLIDRSGEYTLPLMTKEEVADRLLDRVAAMRATA